MGHFQACLLLSVTPELNPDYSTLTLLHNTVFSFCLLYIINEDCSRSENFPSRLRETLHLLSLRLLSAVLGPAVASLLKSLSVMQRT